MSAKWIVIAYRFAGRRLIFDARFKRHSYYFRLPKPYATHCNRLSSTDKISQIKPQYVQLQNLDLPLCLPAAPHPTQRPHGKAHYARRSLTRRSARL